MFRMRYLAFMFLTAFLAGCTSQKQEQTQTPPPQQPAPPEAAPPQSEGAGAAGVPAQAPQSAAPVAKAPAEPPKPVYAVIPSGTKVDVRLMNALSSAENKAGDKFSASLDQDLSVNGKVIAPRGSPVVGKVVSATPSGRVKGRANIALALTDIELKNASYPLQTNTLSFEAEGTKKKDAVKIGAGTGIGAAIGAIAGGGKGAAIGAAVGAGAGTATVLATKGKEVKFGAEDKFSFALQEGLRVRVR